MKLLELFSGTGSVGKVAKELGWEVISLDLLFPSTHQIDILDFNYKQYPKDTFDIVWASPPCVFYSNLQNSNIGRKVNGSILTKELLERKRMDSDKLVEKTMEIINYFNPVLWFMENPQTGQLRNREVIKGLDFYDVDYCMYCDWGYRKRTRIWTNKVGYHPLLCNKNCGNFKNGKHVKQVNDYGGGSDREQRYAIPPELIKSLLT